MIVFMRVFPQDTKKSEKLYKKRIAVERTNRCLELFWGLMAAISADHNDFMSISMLRVYIVLAFLLASCPKWEGTLNKIRLSPIVKALQNKMPGKNGSS